MRDLCIIIDWGTKNLVVGAQLTESNKSPTPGETQILRLQADKLELPQIMGYVRRQDATELEFVWGADLTAVSYLTHDTLVMSCDRLKMAVFGTSAAAVEIKKDIEQELKDVQVPEKTVDDLFVRHLTAIKPTIEEAVVKMWNRNIAKASLETMNVKALFAVPEVTDPDKCNKLTKLLSKAKFYPTLLISETEAAGAWHTFKYCKGAHEQTTMRNLFAPGQELLVVDMGGWTCNIASYTITGLSHDNVQLGMRPTGGNWKSSSELGSEMITTEFINFAKHTIKTDFGKPLDQALQDLDITERALNAGLSRDIESFKACFEFAGQKCCKIRGAKAAHYVDVTAENMMTWLKKAARLVVAAINKIKTDKTRTIHLTGGFSLNTYLVGRLKAHYEKSGITVINDGNDIHGEADFSVVRGGGSRVSGDTTASPLEYALGIPQDEHWDQHLHADVGAGEIFTANGESWVKNRWKTILPLGMVVESDRPTTEMFVLEFVLDPKPFQFKKQVYWTAEDIQEHAPMTPGGRLLPGLHTFGSELEFHMSLAEVKRLAPDRKQRVPTRIDGTMTHKFVQLYKLYLFFRVETNGMNCTLTVLQGPDGFELYRCVNKVTGHDEQKEIKGVTVWQQRYPREKDLRHLAGTKLLDSKYYAGIKRREEVDMAGDENVGGTQDRIEVDEGGIRSRQSDTLADHDFVDDPDADPEF